MEEQRQERASFDFKQFEELAVEQLRKGKPLEGKDGVLAPLIKRLVEASLAGEMDVHLQQQPQPNRRNGKMSKRVKTGFGAVEIDTPRDRQGSFTPLVLPKRQTVLGEALDHKVISLYGKGMSYTDISTHLEDLYGLVVSPASLTAITNRVLDDVRAWQSRTLESVYPMVWLDAIHYKVKEEGTIKTKAVYCVIGLNREGIKDLLGLYIGESEGARFWLSVLTDLQSRGVKDIFIACIDNLKGFADAVESIYPQTEVQLCVIHQIRNTTKYVAWKDQKEVMADLKMIYGAVSTEEAEVALKALETKWNKKYPLMIKSWNANWHRLSHFFKYPKEIRKMIYTTNMIESFHSQLRKVTKTKRVFPSDDSLLKLLYLVFQNHHNGWFNPVHAWKQIQAQLRIIFEHRFTPDTVY